MRCNVYVSDTAWEALKQLAYDCGYVRGVGLGDRPRGMSHFITMLSWQVFKDTRPEYLLDTGQWMTGMEKVAQRGLELAPGVISDLGHTALLHGIYPFRSQAPVANGFKRDARPPKLYTPGSTPRGGTSVIGLVGPVLDAIGVGHLTSVRALSHAPPNLYSGPSKRYAKRRYKEGQNRTLM